MLHVNLAKQRRAQLETTAKFCNFSENLFSVDVGFQQYTVFTRVICELFSYFGR
jgi:hypothetical protein